MDGLALMIVGIAAAVAAVCSAFVLGEVRGMRRAQGELLRETEGRVAGLEAAVADARAILGSLSQWAVGDSAVSQQRHDALMREFSEASGAMGALRRETADWLEKNRDTVDARLGEVRTTVEQQLGSIRDDNQRQLDRMRETVDEKLTRTLNDRLSVSFKQVSDQLEAVYTGLGDMRNIASGVGDLKRVLSNVKTRGILGEVQLGAILADILAPDQYA